MMKYVVDKDRVRSLVILAHSHYTCALRDICRVLYVSRIMKSCDV